MHWPRQWLHLATPAGERRGTCGVSLSYEVEFGGATGEDAGAAAGALGVLSLVVDGFLASDGAAGASELVPELESLFVADLESGSEPNSDSDPLLLEA